MIGKEHEDIRDRSIQLDGGLRGVKLCWNFYVYDFLRTSGEETEE